MFTLKLFIFRIPNLHKSNIQHFKIGNDNLFILRLFHNIGNNR